MLLKKKTYDLQEGERLDDLIINGLKIFQHEQQFCFSLDAVLLAHFAFLKKQAYCVDLGAGTGVISLLLAARGAKKIEAIELNPVTASLAERSISYNNLSHIITVHHTDFRNIAKVLIAGSMDLVVSNPPYRPLNKGAVNNFDAVAKARHEINGTLQDVVEAAKYLLKFRGRFAMVHLPERLGEIMVAMHQVGIEPKRLQLVHSLPDRSPTMVLIEGVLGAKPGIEVAEPFIVHNPDGTYTKRLLDYYQLNDLSEK